MSERSDQHMFTFQNRSFRLLTILFLFAAMIGILVLFKGVLLPFIFAIVVAYVMEPLVRRMNRRPIYGFYLPRWTCVIVLYILFLGILTSFVVFFLPPMYRELTTSVEKEWPKLKADLESYFAAPAPAPEEGGEPEGEGPVALEEGEAEGEGKPDQVAARPEITKDQLRLTDWDGEVVWVPRRLGEATVNVYSAPDQVDAYLAWLKASQAEPQAKPPTPSYSTRVHVQPGWSMESPQLAVAGKEPERAEPVARLGQRTELRFRWLGQRPDDALVEIVYPGTGELPELRDFTRREFQIPQADAAAAEVGEEKKELNLLALGEQFVKKQGRNAFNWFSKEAEGHLQRSVEYVAPVVGAVFKTIFTIFLVLMLAAFISSDLRRIQKFAYELVPPSYRPQFEELMGGLDRGLSGVIRGQLFICMINGTLTGIGLYWMDVPFWHVLTLVVTVLTLIPIFGTILSSIPCVLFGITVSFGTGVMVLLWILAIHALEAYYLNPKVMGHSAHIHPVLVVFALVAGENTYGLIGALLAVPFASILQNLFLFVHKRLVAATEEEAQRTGIYFRKKPRVVEEEEARRRQAKEQEESTRSTPEGEKVAD